MNMPVNKLIVSAFRYAIPILLVIIALALLASPFPYLAPLPAAGVLALLWFGKRALFPYLFYGIVLLVPFGAYRGLSGSFSFMRLHWFFAVALAAVVLIGVLLRKRIPPEVRQRKFWVTVALFFIVNVFAALGSKFPQVSAQFMPLLLAGYMLIALGMIVVDQKGFAQTLPRVIVGSIFVSSVLALLGGVLHVSLFVSPLSGRVIGTTSDPNNMSLMIIFSLPLVVYFLLTARRPLARMFMFLVLAVDMAAVMATFSRGGALILGVSLLLMTWEFRRLISPRNLGLLLGLSGFVVATLILLAPDSYSQRIQSIRAADDLPMRRRASYLLAAREMVADRPIFGSGPDTFSLLYPQTELGRGFRRKGETGERDAHNTYVEVLVGSGILGLTAFLALLFYCLRSFIQAQKAFLASGRAQMALLTVAYRISYLTLLIYLLIFSEVTHKYLLLALAVSQIALRLSQSPSKPEMADV